MSLLALAAARLASRKVRFALVGTRALAAHGVSRPAPDVDLLVVNPGVLDPAFWEALGGARAEVASGAPDAPLAGTVRLTHGDEIVDVVAGKMSWQQDVLARARSRVIDGADVPVAAVVDLILLKLYAGRDEDAGDIERLLSVTDRESITEQVDGRLNQLPPECARLWRRILTGR